MTTTTAPDRPTVGYGVSYTHGYLAVPCGRCKAPVGQPCTGRPNAHGRWRGHTASHSTRIDRAIRLFQREAFALYQRLEAEALERDPDGPLWVYTGTPHHCGRLGAHPLTECSPVGPDVGPWDD